MEEKIKKFLEEESEKYKNIIWIEDTGYNVHKMQKEIYDYLYINRKEVNKIADEEFKELENYAVELSKQFIDQGVAHAFWYSLGYGYRTNPD